MKTSMSSLLCLVAIFLTTVNGRAFWGALYNSAFGNSTSFLPSLRPTARFFHGRHAVIKFSAYSGRVVLFVNGIRKRRAGVTPSYIRLFLIEHDVVAFKLKRFGELAGLMATIKWGQETYRTGIDRFTVREDYHGWEKWERQAWNALVTYKNGTTGVTHNFCHWDLASKTGTTTNKFDKEASFVSRLTGNHQRPTGAVFVRFVIGGENCKTSKDDQDESENSSDMDGSEKVSGNSDDGGSGFCACKLTEVRGGECYDMVEPNAISGRCSPRPCQPTFECVASSDKVCMKRMGGTKLIMETPNFCKTIIADDMETLMPYEG